MKVLWTLIPTLLLSLNATAQDRGNPVEDSTALSQLAGAYIHLHHLTLTLGANRRTTDQGWSGTGCFFTDDAEYYRNAEVHYSAPAFAREERQYREEDWYVVDTMATGRGAQRLEILSVVRPGEAANKPTSVRPTTPYAFICATPLSNFMTPGTAEDLRDEFFYRLWITR